jgi:hypothetical protein
MTNSQDWERRRNRWADYKAQQEKRKRVIMDKPQEGKVYRLTGDGTTPSIANGNMWEECEVEEHYNDIELDTRDDFFQKNA